MPAPFYLVVEGQRGPKRPHSTIESAAAEAARLFAAHNGESRVLLLETVQALEAAVKVPTDEKPA